MASAKYLFKTLRFLFITLVLLVLIYVGWYFWLSIQVPSWQYNESYSTVHFANKDTKEFHPTQIKVPCCLFKISSEHDTIGGHYINLIQWVKGFDPDRPAGIITWKGKTVGYFYGGTEKDFKKYNYHWHIHKYMCVTSGADTTTDLDFLSCLKHGYLPATPFLSRYMLHVWIVPNPYGINEMYNPLLK